MTKDYWDLIDKPQTRTKLNILKDYLNAWAKIFVNQRKCKKLYYVDCFAGRGKYHYKDQKNAIDGSPLIGINVAKEIKTKYGREMTCFFIERDSGVFRNLQSFVEPLSTKVQVQTIKGDINEKIDEVLTQIPDNRWSPIFFFVDPSGINIKSESIKKMLKRSNIKEFLITYIQKGVERCLGFGSKTITLPLDVQGRAISNLKRVEDFFGTSWENLTKNEKENLKQYLNVFIEYNKTRSAEDKLQFRVIDIFYNRGRNKYYLIFVSRNKTALKIIEDIYTKIKTKGTLFYALPPPEKKKIFGKGFDVIHE